MKVEDVIKKIEEFTNDEMIRIISKKILIDLEKTSYFKYGCSNKRKEVICGAIIYIAHIKADNPKTIESIRNLIPWNIHYETKEINKTIKNIKRALRMKYCKTQTMMGTACMVLRVPEDYFVDLCKKENTPQDIIDIGREISKKVNDNPLFQSCNPNCVGGAIFYMACILGGIKLTQRDVADKINVTEVTIRNISRKILDIDEKLSKEFQIQKRKRRKERKEWDLSKSIY